MTGRVVVVKGDLENSNLLSIVIVLISHCRVSIQLLSCAFKAFGTSTNLDLAILLSLSHSESTESRLSRYRGRRYGFLVLRSPMPLNLSVAPSTI
jgi:hypothetical protein